MLTEADYKILLLENEPPSLDLIIEALKKSGEKSPYTAAFSMFDKEGKMVCAMCGAGLEPMNVAAGKNCGTCETMPFSSASALARGKKESVDLDMPDGTRLLCESAMKLEAIEGKADATGKRLEGPRVKVRLITEGLGNTRDKNYYGPEAIQSAVTVFEGAVCMVNHPSYAEERDQPEGKVERTVGYYKGLKAVEIDSPTGKKWACDGELHFDLSEAGAEAYAKAQTAVHYNAEFPDSDKDYIGLSVNAYGDAEPREMMVDGSLMEVNYVKRFVASRSCDIVTMAGRGGKILALVESTAGARGQKREEPMLMKKIKEAQKLLAEAQAEKDATLREAKTASCNKVLEALMGLLEKAGVRETEVEETDDEKAKKAKAEKDKKDKAEKEAAQVPATESDREAHGIAVKSLIKESGLSEAHFDMAELNGMTFKEAKREIEKIKRVSNANVKAVLESIGPDARTTHAAKILEAGSQGAKDNNALFADCSC